MSSKTPQRRVCVYIDGFNLYHAIDALDKSYLKWLNLMMLARTFLRKHETLERVHFFTAILKWSADKQKRHRNYINALKAVGVIVHEANFKRAEKHCQEFGRYCRFYEEKQTDVAIAVTLISEAFDDVFDRAILVTADTDQIPTAKLFYKRFPTKQLALVAPPLRLTRARELGEMIKDKRELKQGRLGTCLLPRNVYDATGTRVAVMPAKYIRA